MKVLTQVGSYPELQILPLTAVTVALLDILLIIFVLVKRRRKNVKIVIEQPINYTHSKEHRLSSTEQVQRLLQYMNCNITGQIIIFLLLDTLKLDLMVII